MAGEELLLGRLEAHRRGAPLPNLLLRTRYAFFPLCGILLSITQTLFLL